MDDAVTVSTIRGDMRVANLDIVEVASVSEGQMQYEDGTLVPIATRVVATEYRSRADGELVRRDVNVMPLIGVSAGAKTGAMH